MPNDGQIVFEVIADGKKAVANVRDITEAIKRESKKWDDETAKGTKGMEDSFAAMAKKVVGGISAMKVAQTLLNWGKAAVDAASDLQEVQNVVDTTFGDGAAKIERWAKAAGTQFGLTETQAKRFTSTLGAMMKSAGMSGDEIVEMSTDLAGLAADMASFYNLDFDTAFQKIRSGISGETEPLKQLGVNMSVANLEAFALQQGLSKTFNQMTQGEQTMLRYQYLMQATADAQGDFSKTSDGYANSIRRIETAINTLNTKAGNFILETINPITAGLAELLEKLTQEPPETLFEKINKINIDTDTKLADIKKVSDKASALIDTLGFISGTDAGEALEKMANGANKLDASSPSTWNGVLEALQGVDGLQNIFSNTKAAGGVEALANALSGADLGSDKVSAWQTLLGTLSENAGALSSLTGKDEGATKEWLEGIAKAVNAIDSGDADAWDRLLTTLVSGFVTDTPQGQSFIEGLASGFLALGSDSDTAVKGLEKLGFSSEQITDKQTEWLKICKQLVQTIPGLSEIIDTETGAVTGGVGALNQYVEEWKTSQEKLVYWRAFYAKKQALAETQNSLYSMETTAGGANIALENFLKNNPRIQSLYSGPGGAQAVAKEGGAAGREFLQLWEDAKKATEQYNTAIAQSDELTRQLANEEEYLKERFGEYVEAENEATDATKELTAEQKESVTVAQEASKALADYVQGIRDATSTQVGNTLTGFNQIKTAKEMAEEAANKLKDLKEELKKAGKTDAEIKIKLDAENAQVTIETLRKGLQSQLDYIREYTANLRKAQELGVSGDLLASLSDGSTESAQTLYALVEAYQNWDTQSQGIPKDIEELNRLFTEVNAGKENFTDVLTQQKLSVDETYQAMVENAKAKISEMDLGEEAKAAMGDTVSGIAQGITDHVSEVQEAVNAIIAELDRLNGYGISINLGSFGSLSFIPQHETGLDRVPFDGYLASLHEGEGVLTAEENRIWQRFKNGDIGSRNVDYETLGATMRDNVKPGGNVYLEGRVVGQVVSDMQGSQYRTLKRSGWQG